MKCSLGGVGDISPLDFYIHRLGFQCTDETHKSIHTVYIIDMNTPSSIVFFI